MVQTPLGHRTRSISESNSEQFTWSGHNSTALSELESILFFSLCMASQLWVPLCFSFVDSLGFPPLLVSSDMSYSQTQAWIFNLNNQWDSHNSFMRTAPIFNTVLIYLLNDVWHNTHPVSLSTYPLQLIRKELCVSFGVPPRFHDSLLQNIICLYVCCMCPCVERGWHVYVRCMCLSYTEIW